VRWARHESTVQPASIGEKKEGEIRGGPRFLLQEKKRNLKEKEQRKETDPYLGARGTKNRRKTISRKGTGAKGLTPRQQSKIWKKKEGEELSSDPWFLKARGQVAGEAAQS